ASGFVYGLQTAPQLVNLAKSVTTETVSTTNLPATSTTYAIALRKTGDGQGSIEARAGGQSLFGGAEAVDVHDVAGVSMACTLSCVQCSLLCAKGAGAVFFGGPCTKAECGKTDPASYGGPRPLDFQGTESCKQNAALADTCNAPLRAESASATAYRVAVH